MKILVTGCNGFVAGSLIESLKGDCEIIGVGRQACAQSQDFAYIQADISHKDELLTRVSETVEEADVIIHAAAYLGADEFQLYRSNCIGTQNVVELAKLLNCKQVIYISSVPVIGKPTEIPITEQHDIRPRTVYHYTKYFGELILGQLEGYGICSTILRIASPVGKGMPNNKIFSVFAKNGLKNQDIVIQGNGTRIQNYLDVRDLAEAIKKVIEKHPAGTYIVNGNSVSDRELAERCIFVNKSQSKVVIKGNSDIPEESWIPSGELAEKEFGYTSKCSLEDSIRYVLEGMV
ncbi:MAG: NAD(P)-dependent oxidoreductase [Lachnospiraceae bacterium]|nr:NAD(P)-dependent oxidoreductase [Lachnospiraceae bacterium]